MNAHSKEALNVWIVDDDGSIRWVLTRALEQAGHRVDCFENGELVTERLSFGERPQAIITDIRMPGVDGIALLEFIRSNTPDLPVIVMTAHTDLDAAVASFQGGAFEYLPKPFDIDRAVELIEQATARTRRDGAPANETRVPSGDIVGAAPAMQEVFRAIGRLSSTDFDVLVLGASGTGKELVARSIYENSPRASAPFVALNMAAIPAELLESELFGHDRGAFTGAVQQRTGRFEQANGGTLFLDEIGDMPAPLQSRLLRVLSDGCFYRVGGRDQINVDVRIIAATNRDLDLLVKSGQFREDLFHRLNVVRLSLPALSDRREDIPELAERFLTRLGDELKVERKFLDRAALTTLVEFDWPGNVRQLENVCRWLTVMAPGEIVNVGDLPEEIRNPREQATVAESTDSDWLSQLRRIVVARLDRGDSRILDALTDEFERLLIETALSHTQGHKQEAARRLGWGRNTLTRKLKELNIE